MKPHNLKAPPQYQELLKKIPEKAVIPSDAYSSGPIQVNNKAHNPKITHVPYVTKAINPTVMDPDFQYKPKEFRPYGYRN